MIEWGDKVLPANLQGKRHWDWPWPFSLIPRGWTALRAGCPKQLLGTQKEVRPCKDQDCLGTNGPAPIGEPGTWQLSLFTFAPWYLWPFLFYFAWSGKVKNGRYNHFRIGARWDDVDSYIQWPTIARRNYSLGDSDTSTT